MSEAAHPYVPTDLGVTVVTETIKRGGNAGRRLRVPVAAIRSIGVPQVVTVLDDPRRVVAGDRDGGPTYSVSVFDDSPNCRITTRGCLSLGLDVGDEVRFQKDADAIRMEVLDDV